MYSGQLPQVKVWSTYCFVINKWPGEVQPVFCIAVRRQLRFGTTRMRGQLSFNFRSMYELQCVSVTSDEGWMTKITVQKVTREIRRPAFQNIPTIRASMKYKSHWNTLTQLCTVQYLLCLCKMICTQRYTGLRAVLNALAYASRYKNNT